MREAADSAIQYAFLHQLTNVQYNTPTTQTLGMPTHDPNLQFKIPDSEQNLAYHMPRHLPRYGEGYMGCRTPPPRGGGQILKLSPQKHKDESSIQIQHLNTKPHRATTPNLPLLAHQPINRQQPYKQQGERKVSKLLEVKLPPSNVF